MTIEKRCRIDVVGHHRRSIESKVLVDRSRPRRDIEMMMIRERADVGEREGGHCDASDEKAEPCVFIRKLLLNTIEMLIENIVERMTRSLHGVLPRIHIDIFVARKPRRQRNKQLHAPTSFRTMKSMRLIYKKKESNSNCK